MGWQRLRKGESQKLWIELLVNIFGVENISEFNSFEDQVHLDHISFIDGYIPTTRVTIEQKSIGKDLRKPIRQSGGSMDKKDLYRYMKMWYYTPEYACCASGYMKDKVGDVLNGKDVFEDSLFVAE